MTSETESIFACFLKRVKSYQLAGFDKEIADEMLSGYLNSVIYDPYVAKLFTDIEYDEDVGEVEYTMRTPWNDGTDQKFVEEMLALGMVIEWVGFHVNSEENILQFFSNSDLRFFSQANHLTETKDLLMQDYRRFKKYIRDRGYSLALVNTT